MPAGIITQTCPAPECNLLPGDVEQFVDELAAYYRLFEPAFRRPEQAKWGEVYLNGLLGALARKTTERIALDLGQNVSSWFAYFKRQFRELQHPGHCMSKKTIESIVHRTGMAVQAGSALLVRPGGTEPVSMNHEDLCKNILIQISGTPYKMSEP
jgi:hypothetical protein